MGRKALLGGLVVIASLALPACSAGPTSTSGHTLNGAILTSVQLRLAHDPGAGEQPIPNPPFDDSQWIEICKGNRVLMTGTSDWYYAPDSDPVNLEQSQVTIKDAKGEIVGLPKLSLTSGERVAAGQGACSWSFTVDDFDSTADFFTVEVAGVPGVEKVSRADLLGRLILTLGS